MGVKLPDFLCDIPIHYIFIEHSLSAQLHQSQTDAFWRWHNSRLTLCHHLSTSIVQKKGCQDGHQKATVLFMTDGAVALLRVSAQLKEWSSTKSGSLTTNPVDFRILREWHPIYACVLGVERDGIMAHNYLCRWRCPRYSLTLILTQTPLQLI